MSTSAPGAPTQAARSRRLVTISSAIVRYVKIARWPREVGIVVGVYGLYQLGRMASGGRRSEAVANGRDIIRWESMWNLHPEIVLNEWISDNLLWAVAASYFYAALHYVVTPAVLIWVFLQHHRSYTLARNTLIASTFVGLVGFYVLPTAPPRLVPGLQVQDTLAQTQEYGWWDSAASVPRGLANLANQYAAMPSLHVGWALWCGVLIGVLAHRTWVKTLGVLYPCLTSLVVLATGNHYFIDVFAGALTMGLGLGLALAFRTVCRRNMSDARS